MLYHAQTPSETLTLLKSSEKGLHQIYAEGRLSQYGRNEIRLTRTSLWRTILGPFLSIFVLVLMVALIFSVLAGHDITALLLGSTLFLYVAMRYLQGYGLERTLRRAEHSIVAQARVIRDGIESLIDPALLVPGDLIVLQSGDRVPADGRIIHAQALTVNQIHLTGNADPVSKDARTLHSNTPLEERRNMVLRGSFVTSGNAKYVITATGNKTHYGQISSSATKLSTASHLQQEIDRTLGYAAMAGFTIATLVAIVGFSQKTDVSSLVEYFVAVLSAAVPIYLPVAASVIVAIGIRQLFRQSILLTSIRSVESTGNASVLVSDKTGILTRNKLTIKEAWSPTNAATEIVRGCERALLRVDTDEHDQSLRYYIKQEGGVVAKHQPATHFAFSKHVGMSGNLWHNGGEYILYLKGTPEKILDRAKLTEQEYEVAHRELQRLTGRGYHVLALAHGETTIAITKLSSLPKRHTLHFDGFIAMQDHLHADARTAMKRAERAGIVTKFVTGDHLETAYQLGRTLGIVSSREQVFDCRKLAITTDSQLARIVHSTVIFARATPEHKYRILSALKRTQTVIMTGDSIDDVPMLTHAHVGVSTQRSSRIAREASDMVLLDSKFSTVLDAVRTSRTILGNIRRMAFFIAILSLSELGLILGTLCLGLPAALLPAQLLWINLLLAITAAIPLGLEPHSRNIMTRKPVSRRTPILPTYLTLRALVLATTVASVSIVIFRAAYEARDIDYARSLVLFALVTMLLVCALVSRSDHTSTLVRFRTWSPYIYTGVVCALLLQAILFTTPAGQLLSLAPLTVRDVMISTLLAIASPFIVGEMLKLYSRHTVRQKGRSYS